MTDDDRNDWSPAEQIKAITMGVCPGTRHKYVAKEVSVGIGLKWFGLYQKKVVIFCEKCGNIIQH